MYHFYLIIICNQLRYLLMSATLSLLFINKVESFCLNYPVDKGTGKPSENLLGLGEAVWRSCRAVSDLWPMFTVLCCAYRSPQRASHRL
jgi:hypothetical protein